MVKGLLGWLFNKVIGDFPEEKKKELATKFKDLMIEVVKAGMESGGRGFAKELKK